MDGLLDLAFSSPAIGEPFGRLVASRGGEPGMQMGGRRCHLPRPGQHCVLYGGFWTDLAPSCRGTRAKPPSDGAR